MKTITRLCLLAVLLITSVSCSRIVHADYELVDKGYVITNDHEEGSVTIRSSLSNKKAKWFIDPAGVDGLSLWALGYTDKITIGDEVNIYRHDGVFLASGYNVDDAKNINQTVTSLYWRNMADNWYFFLLIFIVLGIMLSDIHRWLTGFKTGVFACIMCISICCLTCIAIGNPGAHLYQVESGTITEITPEYVKINDYFAIPYAHLNDMSTHTDVKVGQNINAYVLKNAEHLGGVFSSYQLNEKSLKASQSYPEVLLMTIFLFVLCSTLSVYLFKSIDYQIEKKRKK